MECGCRTVERRTVERRTVERYIVTLLHGNLYIIKFSIKRWRLSLVYGRQKVSAPTKGY